MVACVPYEETIGAFGAMPLGPDAAIRTPSAVDIGPIQTGQRPMAADAINPITTATPVITEATLRRNISCSLAMTPEVSGPSGRPGDHEIDRRRRGEF